MIDRKMKQLALAVGVALGGMSLLPSAEAVNVSTKNQGQAVIFPYYTVNDGWSTLFSITNTSNMLVVAKVRFREAYNSRDVFDFDLILSPRDVWTGWVANTSTGAAVFTEDTSCTVGIITSTGQPFPAPVAYTGTATDGGPTTAARQNEGHVEVITMGMVQMGTPNGATDPLSVLRGAVHVNGVPPGCANLVTAFQTLNGYTALQGLLGYDAGVVPGGINAYTPLQVGPVNPLSASFSFVNGLNGLNTAGRPVHLENFFVPAAPGVGTTQAVGTAGTGTGTANPFNNLLTAQLAPASLNGIAIPPLTAYSASWHEPSMNSANTLGIVLASVIGAPGSPSVAAPTSAAMLPPIGANAVSFVLAAQNVINEWTNRTNPASGWTTQTDWTVTFPTKNFYVDQDFTNQFAGRNQQRGTPGGPTVSAVAAAVNLPVNGAGAVTNPAPFANFFVNKGVSAVFAPAFNILSPVAGLLAGSSCDGTTNTLYNREEGSITGQGFSPGGSNSICYEANVLTFGTSNVLKSAAPIAQNLSSLPGVYGWMNLGLSATGGAAGNPGWLTVTGAVQGLPAVGFEIFTRTNATTGNTSLNSAGLVNHAYLP